MKDLQREQREARKRGREQREKDRLAAENQEQKRIAEIEAAKRTAELKTKVWTRQDLHDLLYKHTEILNDVDRWTEKGLYDDLSQLRVQLTKEWKENTLMGIEKKEINPHGVDYLYWLLLQHHIISQDFYIEINKDGQPVLHDNQKNPSDDRKKKMSWLQKTLNSQEWQQDKWSWLRSNDNTPKIATYLAALAYHHGGASLMGYRAELENKISTDPNKKELSASEIKNSDLDAWQKSFLLAWRERSNDTNLQVIEGRQREYVERAQENFNKKSPEQHMAELSKRPIGKTVELIGWPLIGVALLAVGLKKMFGKSGVMWKIFGTLATVVGSMILIPTGDAAWKKLWGAEMLNTLVQKPPVDRENAVDNPFPKLSEKGKETWDSMKEWVSGLQWRISGPAEWTALMTKPEIAPTVEMSSWSMLYILHAGDPEQQEKFKEMKPNAKEKEKIEAAIKGLDASEKESFKKLVQDSWDRYIESPGAETDPEKLKKITLWNTIESIDEKDGWVNKLPEWAGWMSNKTAALKIIAPKAKEWWDMTAERLKKYFVEWKTGEKNDREIFGFLNEGNGLENYNTIKSYLESLDISDKQSTTTLREILTT